MPESLATALEEAFREAQKSMPGSADEETAEEAELPEAPEDESAAPADGEVEVDTDTASEDEPEAPQGTGDEVPKTYFGVDLSAYSPEDRRGFIDELKERDQTIQRLMQRNAELRQSPEESAPAGEPAEPEALDDAALLKALGIDEDDPFYDLKSEAVLPLAKMVVPLSQKVQQMEQERQVDQMLAEWNTALDTLEGEFGKLPVERDAFILDAVEHGLFDPSTAYHAATGAARARLTKTRDTAADAAKAAVAQRKRATAGGVRPRTSAAEGKNALDPSSGISLHDAIEQSLRVAEQETGITLRSLSDDLWNEDGTPV